MLSLVSFCLSFFLSFFLPSFLSSFLSFLTVCHAYGILLDHQRACGFRYEHMITFITLVMVSRDRLSLKLVLRP